MKPLAGKSFVAVPCGFAFALLILLVTAPVAGAQNSSDAAQQEGSATQSNPAPGDSAGLLAQLNLSAEQVGQMREIQTQSVPEARALTRRLNLARRALDAAIYSDTLDEALIDRRAREVAEAQAALVHLRAETELRVRRLLTPEQLQTFRNLRQQARVSQRLQRQLNRGDNTQRPRRNALDNRLNRTDRPNQRSNSPTNQTPDARPFTVPRERRRSGLRRP
jgi:Spy/CpxP family protein refolding chaperone